MLLFLETTKRILDKPVLVLFPPDESIVYNNHRHANLIRCVYRCRVVEHLSGSVSAERLKSTWPISYYNNKQKLGAPNRNYESHDPMQLFTRERWDDPNPAQFYRSNMHCDVSDFCKLATPFSLFPHSLLI